MFPIVTKRNGSQAAFSSDKIHSALSRCFNSISVDPKIGLYTIVDSVVQKINTEHPESVNVEDIQDTVEKVLQDQTHLQL